MNLVFSVKKYIVAYFFLIITYKKHNSLRSFNKYLLISKRFELRKRECRGTEGKKTGERQRERGKD